MVSEGQIKKLVTTLDDQGAAQYAWPIGDQLVPMNAWLGSQIRLEFVNDIHCVACGRSINKTFQNGYCFVCFRSLAQCDLCIVKPELCHYDQGTCREPKWGLEHCMQDHIVYLANSSGLKLGITKMPNIPSRWIDQGSVEALPIIRAKTRLAVGLVEVAMAPHGKAKTN